MKYFFIAIFFLNTSFGIGPLFLPNGEQTKNYYKILDTDKLKEGERIYVSEDKYFIYKEKLGQGGVTLVLKVLMPTTKEEVALRLPYSQLKKLNRARANIDYFAWGDYLLERQNINKPKILEHVDSQYNVVELIPHSFTLNDLVASKQGTYSNKIKSEATHALAAFYKSLAGFEDLSDFNPDQLVYNHKEKKWYLIDWSDGHVLASGINSPHILDRAFFESISEENLSLNDEFELRSKKKIFADHADEIIKKERESLIAAEKSSLKKFFAKMHSLNSAEDYIDFYKRKPHVPFTNNTLNHFFDHFLNNESKLRGLTPDQYLKIAREIVNKSNAVEFHNIVINNLQSSFSIERFNEGFLREFDGPEMENEKLQMIRAKNLRRKSLEQRCALRLFDKLFN